MKYQKTISFLSGLIILAIVLIWGTGCQYKTLTEPDPVIPSATIDDADIAMSVATVITEDGGGVVDQLGDMSVQASNQGIQAISAGFGGMGSCRHNATYDSLTQTWTIVIFRERGEPADSVYHLFERTHTLQFLNQAGTPQKFWITDGDTAMQIIFDIVSGSGEHKHPHRHHILKSIGGGWTADNVNTDMITVNGTYQRAALDTIFRQNGMRISDHTLDLTLTDVTGPRGSRRDLSQKVSGSITGTYHAFVTVIKSDTTFTNEITRDINIELGSGNASITVGGHRYRYNTGTGECQGS